jgi:GTP-binding protein
VRARRPPAVAGHRGRTAQERSLTGGAPSFVASLPRGDAPLDPPLPEVAVIGRSNVGKSSLLNALLGRKIAKVSATPGKTRMLNVFRVDPPTSPRPHAPAPPSFYILDLPGYGYARVSQAERAGYRRLFAAILQRPRLHGVLWLLDLRHEPSADDRDMQDVLAATGARVLAAFTKADKLPRGRRLERERTLRSALALDAEQSILTSARSGEGIGELREAVDELIGKATA